jgi:hypothetical protein
MGGIGMVKEGLIDFEFAAAMVIAFVLGIVSSQRKFVGKVVDAIATRFEDHRVATFKAVERTIFLSFVVCDDGLPVRLSSSGEHDWVSML